MSTSKKMLIIRFLLEGSHALEYTTTEGEAASVIKQWAERKAAYVLTGYDRNLDRQWAVASERIEAIFTWTPKEEQLPAQQIPSNIPRSPWAGSGM